MGQVAGSTLAAVVYNAAGWSGICVLGGSLAALALIVWLVVSFDTILAYEFIKGILHDKRSVRATLFGDQTRINPSNAVATATPNTM